MVERNAIVYLELKFIVDLYTITWACEKHTPRHATNGKAAGLDNVPDDTHR